MASFVSLPIVFLVLGGVLAAGCGGEPVPEEPEGSFASETVQLEEEADAVPVADPTSGDPATASVDSSAAPDNADLVRPALTAPGGAAFDDSVEVPGPYRFVVTVLGHGRDSVLVRAEEFALSDTTYGYAFIGPYVAATWEEAEPVDTAVFEIVQPRTFSSDSVIRYLEVRTVHQGRMSEDMQRAEFTVTRQVAVVSLFAIIGRTLETLVFLLIAWAFLRGTSWILNLLGERNPSRRLLFKRLDPLIRTVTWVIVVVFIVRVFWDVGQSELIAISAAAGVAIGLASQDVVRNLFGGIVLLTDQPFQVGDKVQIGETYGEVKSIGIRSTRVTTPDDSQVTVPNAVLLNSDVSNANSGNLDMQVVIHLYLPGWVDLRQAKKIAYESAAVSRYVFLEKPIVVLALDEYHDTFVTHLKVKAYVLDVRDEFLFSSDVTERARLEFRKAGLIGAYHGARAWYDPTDDVRQSDPDGSPEDDRPEAVR